MNPVLFNIGSFELRSYGLLLALSFILGIILSVKRAKKRGIDPNKIMDLAVIIIISSIVGSRILYVLFHLEEFRGHWIDTFNPFQSDGQIGIAGLTMLGGVILAIISSIVYLRVKKLPVLKLADTIIPVYFLGEALTRVGCYLNGCCFGVPCHLDYLCVVFPPDSAAGSMFQGIGIHPAQLYQSGYALLMFLLILLFEKLSKYDGFLLYLFFIMYGVGRFIVDFFRYYESSMITITIGQQGISLNQIISLCMVLLGVVLLIRAPGTKGLKIKST